MLLQFVVENYLSFRDRTVLSLLTAEAVEHRPNQVLRGPGDIDVLRCVALYGANASGKSNLVQALRFARDLVLTGTKADSFILFPGKAFRLDAETQRRPAHFEFRLAVDGAHYAYGFEIAFSRVEAEWLYLVKGEHEDPLFERQADAFEFGDLGVSAERAQFIRFVAEGTRPNQLFLAEARDRNVGEFGRLLEAIRSLHVVLSSDPLKSLVDEVERDPDFKSFLTDLLSDAGAGISGLDVSTSDWGEELLARFSPEQRHWLEGEIRSGGFSSPERQTSVVSDEKGRFRLRSLRLFHDASGGTTVPFDVTDESDGTRRLLHLGPTLYGHRDEGDRASIVDELERSLHPQLTRRFLARFLALASGQLIFTTHDTNLLDAHLLPLDSIWFVEKDATGGSKIYPLTDVDPAQIERLSSNLEAGYLDGRFGAIPFFGDPKKLGWHKKEG
jgi:hypothetical protein